MMMLDQHKKNTRISWRNEFSSSSKRCNCESESKMNPGNKVEDTSDAQRRMAVGKQIFNNTAVTDDGTTNKTSDHASCSTPNRRRQVHFGVVLVREHSLTIGDHPMCTDPLPLTLDWMHTGEKRYDINLYEATRTRGCSIIRQGGNEAGEEAGGGEGGESFRTDSCITE